MHGRVSLDVRLQQLRFELSTTPEGPLDFQIDIPARIGLSFRATAFTFIGEGRMVLGGRDVREDGRSFGRLALIDSDTVRGQFEPFPPEWGGNGLQAVTTLGLYPDSSRLVVLDGLGGGLYLCELPLGRLEKVLGAKEHPILLQAVDLELTRNREKDTLFVTVLTEIGGGARGRFSKPYLTLSDIGIDGTFEHID